MKKITLLLLAIPIAFAIYYYKAAHKLDNQQNVVSAASLPLETQTAAVAPENAPEPPKPARWVVTSSPHSIANVERINTALAVYQDMGMTKLGAAYLVGNFISESYLDPSNCHGDGGTACGLAQWRFNRQRGMPTDYVEQLKWAVNDEMQRHTPSLRAALFDQNATRDDLKAGLYKWEVWGILGARWHYAEAVYSQL